MTKRWAVVTGAASGIGKATAEALAQDHHVILADISPAVSEVSAALGPDAQHVVCDLGQAQHIMKLAAFVRDKAGRCDVLVNCAGIHPRLNGGKYSLDDMTLENWNAVVALNLTAPMLLSQQLMPLMRTHQWGRIVNISSRAGRMLIPGTGAHYAATKAGLIGLTRIIAEEGAPFGITANTIAPGRIASPLSESGTLEIIANSIRNIPLKRVGQPAELAGVIRFLASDAASYVTGAVIDVNGGAFMP